MDEVIREMADILAGARRVILCSHVPPDGDGLGAAIALVRVLARRGAQAVFAAGGPVQQNLGFLFRPDEVDLTPAGPEGEFDAAVALDSATFKRLGAAGETCRGTGRFLNIDHHVTNERFGDLDWVDPEASSTGEMVWRLVSEMGVALDAEIALPLLVAVVTDTGRFSYSNTTSTTHRMAAELLAAGADPVEATDGIYRQNPLPYLKLTGMAIDALELCCGGRVAHVSVTAEMIARSGAHPLDVGDVIDIPISVAGAEVGILFRASMTGPGTKLSFRSRRWFPVHDLARRFGGGGHARAAGAEVAEPPDRARAIVLAAVEEEFARADAKE